jgi:hypothetical protein
LRTSSESASLIFFVDLRSASTACIDINSGSPENRSTARAKRQSLLRMFGISMPTETLDPSPPQLPAAEPERLAYSIQEAAIFRV